MPQRQILSIRKASAVLKTEPILCRLLTLSKMMTMGDFSESLKASTDILFSSSFLSFLMRMFFKKMMEGKVDRIVKSRILALS